MVFFSFGNLAFNCESSESTIEMVIGAKSKYDSPGDFLKKVVCYLDEAVYPGDNVAADYAGASIEAGDYKSIVENRLSSMDTKIEINIGTVTMIWQIKRVVPDWWYEDFLIETREEYIFLSWATSA